MFLKAPCPNFVVINSIPEMRFSPPETVLIRTITLSICLFLSVSGSAQNTAQQVTQRLQVIENEVYQNPVSIKSELLGFLKDKAQMPDSTLGEVYLYLSITLGMTNQLDSGIWASKESIRLLPDELMLKASALKTLAILYRLKGNRKSAEESIQLSLQLNDSLWKNDFLKAITLQEYASLSLDQNDYFKATSLFLEALKVIQSAGIKDPKAPYTAVKLRINLAEAYVKCKNYPFAIREFNTALPRLYSLKDIDGYVRGGIVLSEAYIRNKQLQQADSMLKRLTPLAERLQNDELKACVILYTGDAQSARKNYRQALTHYRLAYVLFEKNNSWMLPECAAGLLNALHESGGGEAEAMKVLGSRVLKETVATATLEKRFEYMRAALPFIRKNQTPDELYAYTKELMQLGDSVSADNEKQAAAQIQAEYQFERQQETQELLKRENEVLKQKESYKRNQLYFAVTIALLSFTLLGMFLYRLRQKSREKDKVLLARERELRYQRDRLEWAEKERDLRDQLIQQQKAELVRSVEDAAELRTQLEQLVTEQQEERRKELLVQIEKSKQEKQGIEYLLSQFNAVYPTFGHGLMRKFPMLTASDVQFCTLFRMNLTTKEISTLFNIEYKSVYTRKYRIVEKMGLTATEEFDRVIFGLE